MNIQKFYKLNAVKHQKTISSAHELYNFLCAQTHLQWMYHETNHCITVYSMPIDYNVENLSTDSQIQLFDVLQNTQLHTQNYNLTIQNSFLYSNFCIVIQITNMDINPTQLLKHLKRFYKQLYKNTKQWKSHIHWIKLNN